MPADIYASNWSETDASNNQAAPDGLPEGAAPSGVNNWARATMGAIKRYVDQQMPKTTGGTSTAYTLTYDVAPGALVDGMTHMVLFNAINGASPTLNVNSLGAKPIYLYLNGTWAAVPTGFIGVNALLPLAYHSSSGTYRIQELPSEVILGVQSISGSSFNFTTIPSNINHIRLELKCTVGTDGATVKLQTYGADGVLDTGSTDYSWLATGWTSTPAVAASSGFGAYIQLGGNVDNGSVGFGVTLKASDIQGANYTMFHYQSGYLDSGGALGSALIGLGTRNEADRITGLRITADGNATGRATLFGSV